MACRGPLQYIAGAPKCPQPLRRHLTDRIRPTATPPKRRQMLLAVDLLWLQNQGAPIGQTAANGKALTLPLGGACVRFLWSVSW
jgi:hypothetical protein